MKSDQHSAISVITIQNLFTVTNVRKIPVVSAQTHMVANSNMGYFKIVTPEGVTDIEDMSAEELLGVYVELMKEDN